VNREGVVDIREMSAAPKISLFVYGSDVKRVDIGQESLGVSFNLLN
jgi:hypothetical protein